MDTADPEEQENSTQVEQDKTTPDSTVADSLSSDTPKEDTAPCSDIFIDDIMTGNSTVTVTPPEMIIIV